MERIVEVFEARFGDPYLDPTAELTFEELSSAFPDVPVAELEEGLSHWTNHSGERTLSTKTVESDGRETRVWYIHGLARHHIDPSSSSSRHIALG
jgi:hypothetical protein